MGVCVFTIRRLLKNNATLKAPRWTENLAIALFLVMLGSSIKGFCRILWIDSIDTICPFGYSQTWPETAHWTQQSSKLAANMEKLWWEWLNFGGEMLNGYERCYERWVFSTVGFLFISAWEPQAARRCHQPSPAQATCSLPGEQRLPRGKVSSRHLMVQRIQRNLYGFKKLGCLNLGGKVVTFSGSMTGSFWIHLEVL